MHINYGFGKKLTDIYDVAVEKVTQALAEEGFGIISDINIAATIKNKLNKEMTPYRILGACNPQLAYAALQEEPSIGLLLPCNVVVREDENKNVYVEFMDPNTVLKLVDNPKVDTVAKEVKQRLERVMDKL